ncbi:uncharacterized protein LOC110636261 [Hevea brasiliensis]|uniref:uncharacterized protein LOC110636261 n=1 Tax=Hevea brasiliensis TaxID=3981 RepID=UPI0025F30530|nr:uncharacterized protein LOC110636261 [Hevea brasiliensis]
MDKSWIHESNRLSTNYLQGILNFLQFALKSSKDGKLPCPCIKCVNALRFGQDVVMDHIIKHGFCMSYMQWYCHGESLSTTIEGDHFNNLNLNYGQSSSGVQVGIQQFIKDMVIGHANIGDKGFNSEMVEHVDCGNDQNIEIDGKELNEEAQKFYGFLKKTNEVLFEGSKKHSKLSFILDLFHKKCLNGWSNKSFKDLLGTLRETLPNGENYQSHVMRWVTNVMDFDVGSSTMMRKKKKKGKKSVKRNGDGYLRHPANSIAWKEFDNRYKEFSKDPHNVRLGLASDGFNPFRNMSISPGDKIDVFMQPSIDELNNLWTNGLDTYDAHGHNKFQMRVALMWTINDFPAYGMLLGWNTKSKFACPSCGFDTCLKWLDKEGKYCFMGHHRFLPPNHPFRRDKRNFDGKDELRKTPIRTTGSIGLKQLDGKVVIKNENGEAIKKEEAWNKKSIFFTLPYWEFNLVRHNLDVMHIEKNVCDNILGTFVELRWENKG